MKIKNLEMNRNDEYSLMNHRLQLTTTKIMQEDIQNKMATNCCNLTRAIAFLFTLLSNGEIHFPFFVLTM